MHIPTEHKAFLKWLASEPTCAADALSNPQIMAAMWKTWQGARRLPPVCPECGEDHPLRTESRSP